MNKRTKFVLSSVVLGLSLAVVGSVSPDSRTALVLAVSAVAYVLTVWVLFEDLKGIEWLNLMILPVLFTLTTGLFASLMPSVMPSFWGRRFELETGMLVAKLVKGLFYILFTLGIYGLFLAENIFSVASIRTIQLIRAARSVSFVMSLIVYLFVTVLLFNSRMGLVWVLLWMFMASWILVYQVFWTVDLKNGLSQKAWGYVTLSALVLSLAAGVLAFWPVRVFIGGLMLTAMYYAITGSIEQKMQNKLSSESGWEYFIICLIMLVVGFLNTTWTG